MPVNEKLMKIQTEIKAPKNLYNSFGKYKYRNAEGICEAVKPYLKENNCSLTLFDDIVEVGGRIYVKATAKLVDNDDITECEAVAFARESEVKKGMDDSQITGTASSYARKYALNGLFLLDDTKDADSEENHVERQAKAEKQEQEQKFEAVGKEKIDNVKAKALIKRCESEKVEIAKVCALYKVKNLVDLTENQYSNLINNWDKVKDSCHE